MSDQAKERVKAWSSATRALASFETHLWDEHREVNFDRDPDAIFTWECWQCRDRALYISTAFAKVAELCDSQVEGAAARPY